MCRIFLIHQVTFVDSISCASQCYQSTTNNIYIENNSVYQVFNKLGVPIKHIQNNQIYFYMHKNGTVEKTYHQIILHKEIKLSKVIKQTRTKYL